MLQKFGMGGVLVQSQEKNKDRILGYFSRALTVTEHARGIPEREMMSLVESLECFRPMIFGYKIICLFDQQSIKCLLSKNHPSKYTKFRERIDEFDISLQYVEGNENKSDFISRFLIVAALQETQRKFL